MHNEDDRIPRADRYTVDEAAVLLGASPHTVRRWIREDEIAATHTVMGPGGGYRIDHDELARFVKRRNPYMKLDMPVVE